MKKATLGYTSVGQGDRMGGTVMLEVSMIRKKNDIIRARPLPYFGIFGPAIVVHFSST